MGKLLCSAVVLTLSFDWHMYRLYCATPPYTTVRANAARFLFCTVDGATFYSPTPSTLLLGQKLPVCIRLAARSSNHLHYFGADAARFCIYGWLRDPLLCYPPYTRVGRPFTVLPSYTARRLNAACFGAMSVGALCDPILCYTTTPHLG